MLSEDRTISGTNATHILPVTNEVDGSTRTAQHEDSMVKMVTLPLDQTRLDVLFCTLFLTSLGSLVAGNILTQDIEVFRSSLRMWAACFGCLLVFYTLSRQTGGVLQGFLTTLLLLVVLVKVRQPWTGVLFYAVASVTGGYTAVKLRHRNVPWPNVIAMAILGTAVSFSVFSQFSDFNNLNAARYGFVHKDVYFHSAIAAMVKNYGVTSTGLHGLVQDGYYALSHHVVAIVSSTSGCGVFEVAGVISQIFYIPLLLFSVTYAATSVVGNQELRMEILWIGACLLLVLPQFVFGKWLISEGILRSFTDLPAKCLFLMAIPLLLKPQLRYRDVFWAGAATYSMAWAKLATAVIFAGLWGARWLISKRMRGVTEWAAVLLCTGIVMYFLSPRFGDAATSEAYDASYRMAFLQKSWGGAYIGQIFSRLTGGDTISLSLAVRASAAAVTFLLFHYFLSWTVLVLILRTHGAKSLFTSNLAVMTWASVAGSLVFVFGLNFLDPNVVYPFTSCALFVAMPVFAGYVAIRLKDMGTRRSLALVLVATCAICMVSYRSFYRNSRLYPLHRVRHESALIDELRRLRLETPVNTVLSAPSEVWSLEPVRWGSLFFVGLRPEYGAWTQRPWRTAAPFVYPAISERPWIGVIGPNESTSRYDSYTGWGYGVYDIDRQHGGVLSAPVLLPGMKIVDWELPPEMMADIHDRPATKEEGASGSVMEHDRTTATEIDGGRAN